VSIFIAFIIFNIVAFVFAIYQWSKPSEEEQEKALEEYVSEYWDKD